jgi:hypothetical protein
VALAREGRINGYLSSVQDDLLTGYGTVTPPDVTGAAGQALMALLDEVAPVYPDTRRWFLQTFGQLRSPSAFDLARRILEAPLTPEGLPLILSSDWAGETLEVEVTEGDEEEGQVTLSRPLMARKAAVLAELDQLAAARDALLGLVVGVCGSPVHGDGVAGPRRDLIVQVAAARARGIALRGADDLVGPEGRRWVDARLRGGSVRTDLPAPAVDALTRIVERARLAGVTRLDPAGLLAGAPQQTAPADCNVLPAPWSAGP